MIKHLYTIQWVEDAIEKLDSLAMAHKDDPELMNELLEVSKSLEKFLLLPKE